MKKITVLLLGVSPLLLAGCSLIPGTSQGTDVSNQTSVVSQQTGVVAPTSLATPGPSGTDYQSGISLTIGAPADGSSVSMPTVTVTGKTAPGADVSVNDTDLVADAGGNFSTKLVLDEGENTITVVANDQNGNSAEKEITVTYNAPENQ